MDPYAVLASERRLLADDLEELAAPQWQESSLCEGWSNHVVAAHLNLPWTVGSSAFLLGVLRARGSIDRAMDRFSREAAERLDPRGCVDGLRANATNRFAPPGIGVGGPLTDVVVHGADILRPLGRSRAVSPDALRAALTFVASSKAVRGLGARPSVGLTLVATDVDVTVGSGGPEVSGPALSICGALLGRRAYLADLTGEGVDRLGGAA